MIQEYLEISDEDRCEHTEREIINLRNKMDGINYLFGKLSQIIGEQSIAVDNIQVAINTSKNNVEDGTYQLEKANQNRNKCSNKICCSLVLLVGIMILVVLAIGFLYFAQKI